MSNKTMSGASVLMVLASLSLGACGSSGSDDPPPLDAPDFDTPKPLSMRPEAVTASKHFSDTLVAEDGQLTIPVGAADPGGLNDAVIAKLKIGTVLAGNRDTASPILADSKNAYGFLRRVIDIDRSVPDKVVIHTQQATSTSSSKRATSCGIPRPCVRRSSTIPRTAV